jgi:hypothetical protein
VQYTFGTRTFVEVVYILSHQEKVVSEALFQFGQRKVGGVRFVVLETLAQEVVEVLDALFVAVVTFGGANIVDVFMFPHAVVTAEGTKSRFSTDAGTGQYNESRKFGGTH